MRPGLITPQVAFAAGIVFPTIISASTHKSLGNPKKRIMKSIVKTILLVLGIALILYGTYLFIQPEASVDLLGMSIEEQDNSNAFITMGLGLVFTLIGAFLPKKS
ncbi:MAG: hypothetical protein Roseis2KO_02610 [Roseivirga sp.]